MGYIFDLILLEVTMVCSKWTHQLQQKFLEDMIELAYTAQDVNLGFLGGDFVVKESYGPFNQIPENQGLENVNKMVKIAGGLTGITWADWAGVLLIIKRENLAQKTE